MEVRIGGLPDAPSPGPPPPPGWSHTLREAVRGCLEEALAAVEPEALVRKALREAPLPPVPGEVHLLGVGKAARAMARGALAGSGTPIQGGVLVVPPGDSHHAREGSGVPEPREGLRVVVGGHPLPDQGSVAGSRAALELARELGEGDLLVCLLSGGGSALLTLPPLGISLEAVQRTTQLLLRSGAGIGELNTVRKHLDLLKGGGLALAAAPARVVALVLSDVVGDPPEVIASGPVSPDPTTYGEALAVLRHRGCLEEVPPEVRAHLEAGRDGGRPETPGPEHPVFQGVEWRLVGGNRQALEAAARGATERGFLAEVDTVPLTGEAREAGARIASRARAALEKFPGEGVGTLQPGPPLRPHALVFGGETTVTVTGQGRGGRNQEVALGAALALEGTAGILVAALGTDGVDGPTPAAGALADGSTVARARALGLDPADTLRRNDALPFFHALADLLLTGPTGTNVMDLVVVLVDPHPATGGTGNEEGAEDGKVGEGR